MSDLLFVEGEEDKKFFLSISRDGGIKIDVKCDPRGKGNAINSFVSMLKLQTSASKNRIGLVVDADFPQNGGGFAETQALINQRLQAINWSPLSQTKYSGFKTTSSNASGTQAGVWIMPNNSDNGYAEAFVIQTIAQPQKMLAAYAFQQTAIAIAGGNGIPVLPTKPHHLDKARVGVWLAWSDPPRMSLGAANSNNLLDFNAGVGKNLSDWLTWLYT